MTQTAPTPLRTDWWIVFLLFVVGLFAAAQFGKVSLTLQDLGAHYGGSEPRLALLVSLVGGVGLIFGAMAGAIIARVGPRQALLAALCLGASLSGAQAMMPSFSLLALLRVVEGVSHLAIVVAAPPIMAAVATDRDRPIVMAIWATFFGLSFAISAVIFPPILALGGLPLLFAFHGTGLLILAALLLRRLPNLARTTQPFDPIRLHRTIYTRIRTIAPAVGFVFYTVTYVALLTYLPAALDRPDLGITLPLISLITTMAAGVLCRHIAPDRVAILGFAVSLVGTALIWAGLAYAPHIAFLGLGLIPGACFAAIPYFNDTTPDRSRATGAIAQLGNLGTTTGTPIFAALLAGYGLNGVLSGLALFCCIGLGALVWVGILLRR